MKIVAVVLCLLAATLSIAAKFTTEAFGGQYRIEQDGTVHVQEVISITFTEPQRGLIRKLPFRTGSSRGEVRTVTYDLEGVTQDAGNGEERAETSVSTEGGDWSVRIGNADRFLNGPVQYRISYSIRGAMTPFIVDEKLGEHTEFLWNLTPTQWPTSIGRSAFDIIFPQPEPGPLLARIIVGERGGRRGIEINAENVIVGDKSLISARFEGNKLSLTRNQPLGVGESITLGLAHPGATVRAPAPDIRQQDQSGGWNQRGYEIPSPPKELAFLGFAPLLAVPAIYALARKRWAPPKKPMVVRFDPPPGVGPSLCGLIMDGNVDQHDIVAGIVNLAQKGGIRMHHVGDKASGVALEMLGERRIKSPEEFDLTLYRSLEPYGEVIMPDMLRGTFGQYYNLLVSSLHAESRVRGFMQDVAGTKSSLGCLLFLAIALPAFIVFFFNPCAAIVSAFAAFGIGSWIIGRISPLTPQGHEAKWHLDGLREFISRAHRKELNYMAQRMPDQALFEQLLPYAVAFNLVKEWTNAFEGFDLQMPEWYVGGYGYGAFDMIWTSMLISDLMHMDHHYGESMSYAMPTSDFGTGDLFSSGDSGFGGGWDGGGFDGGFGGGDGGGGGGGDSW